VALRSDPGLLAGWLQGHGGIENRVHHIRVVTCGEATSRLRTGTGPQLMAALGNIDLTSPGSASRPTCPSQRRNAWAGATVADTVHAAWPTSGIASQAAGRNFATALQSVHGPACRGTCRPGRSRGPDGDPPRR